MVDNVKYRGGISRRLKKLASLVQLTPIDQSNPVTGTIAGLPEVCPNCGVSDRKEELFVDENGTLTKLLTVSCIGCGYRFPDIRTLPLSAEADDADMSIAILPANDLRE